MWIFMFHVNCRSNGATKVYFNGLIVNCKRGTCKDVAILVKIVERKYG